MKLCDWTDAYFDGELDLALSLEYEAHLKECSGCTGKLSDRQRLRQALRAPELRYSGDPAGRQVGHKAPLQAAALLALLLGLALLWPKPQALGTRLAEAHIQSLLAQNVTEVNSSEHHTVKPWFQGRLNYSPPVPQLAEQGFPLLGARLQKGKAALVYQRRQHLISLYLWPEVGPDSGRQVEDLRGYHWILWRHGGWRLEAVSDLNSQELEQFCEALERAI